MSSFNAKATHIFSAKNIDIFAAKNVSSFYKIPIYLPYFKIEILTSLSFEQLGPAVFVFVFVICFSYVLLPVPREGCTTCLWSSWFRNVIYVIVTLTRCTKCLPCLSLDFTVWSYYCCPTFLLVTIDGRNQSNTMIGYHNEWKNGAHTVSDHFCSTEHVYFGHVSVC